MFWLRSTFNSSFLSNEKLSVYFVLGAVLNAFSPCSLSSSPSAGAQGQADFPGIRDNGRLCHISFQGGFLMTFLAMGKQAGREPGGAVSIPSHPSPLVFFSGIEREAAFVLLRALLEPLIAGLLLSGRKRTQWRVRWLGQMAGQLTC